MRIQNYLSYGMCIYDNAVTNAAYNLGDVVINDDNEIGVVIQLHGNGEFRVDMFGNTSDSEVRMASDEEIKKYRPNILTEGRFKHLPH